MKNWIGFSFLILSLQGCYFTPASEGATDVNGLEQSAQQTLGRPSERSNAELLDAADRPVPGTVDQVWSESMYDQVRVPAKIDPNNVYYRPSHQTIVEIRQERYQKVEYPDDRK